MQSYDRLRLATTPYVYLTSEKADFACFTRLFAVFSLQVHTDLANSTYLVLAAHDAPLRFPLVEQLLSSAFLRSASQSSFK
jgi:hypothetical protein